MGGVERSAAVPNIDILTFKTLIFDIFNNPTQLKIGLIKIYFRKKIMK